MVNTGKKHYEEYKESSFNGIGIDLFEDVSAEEAKFYTFLLEVIGNEGRGKGIYNKLKKGEWWIVSIEDRVEILRELAVLAKTDKWHFVEEIYVEIAEKIINPKRYLLRKAILDLVYAMDTFEYNCEKRIISITDFVKETDETNIEHRMETIYRNAGLTHLKGGVHILRKTFATEMYENGARVKEIAAYIGDLESTTERYYIAIRKKRIVDGKEEHIVALPTICKVSQIDN